MKEHIDEELRELEDEIAACEFPQTHTVRLSFNNPEHRHWSGLKLFISSWPEYKYAARRKLKETQPSSMGKNNHTGYLH